MHEHTSRIQRILVVHNRYQQAGGEDAVVEAEIALLRQFGHTVEAYERDNHEIEGMSALAVSSQALWSKQTEADVARSLKIFCPDLIHVHNTFPLVSPSVYWTASRANVPIVQTLHNFRLSCLQAMFLRNGRVCEDCLGRLPWRGVVRRCYRGSYTASAVAASTVTLHRVLGTFRSKIARYICLSQFSRRKFIEAGLPEELLSVKPNFVTRPGSHEPEDRRGALFVGRLAPEKGIDALRAALDMVEDLQLDVIGTGPEAPTLAGHPRIRTHGWAGASAVEAAMRRASFLVVPSRCHETFGRVVIEAFANGLPVIASRMGALTELIEEGRTGMLCEPNSPQALAEKMAIARAHPNRMLKMGENARQVYLSNYTPELNYRQLMAVYGDAVRDYRSGDAVSSPDGAI